MSWLTNWLPTWSLPTWYGPGRNAPIGDVKAIINMMKNSPKAVINITPEQLITKINGLRKVPEQHRPKYFKPIHPIAAELEKVFKEKSELKTQKLLQQDHNVSLKDVNQDDEENKSVLC